MDYIPPINIPVIYHHTKSGGTYRWFVGSSRIEVLSKAIKTNVCDRSVKITIWK